MRNTTKPEQHSRVLKSISLRNLRADLVALQNNKALFEESHFNARKEALNFIALIDEIFTMRSADRELVDLHHQAGQLQDRILAFNETLFQQLGAEIKAGVTGERLRRLLAPFTNYTPEDSGLPHYGYENLDGLIEGVLLPLPHPKPTLERAYGMVRYEPTPVSVILELVDQVQFSENDVFYDLGSGLGNVVILVHLLAQIACIGVEYEPAYCDYATQRADDLGLTGVKFINADARNVDYADSTMFFLFNPFGGEIFNTVLGKLNKLAQKHQITICSYGACTPPLAELPWLQLSDPKTNHESKLAFFTSNTN